MDILVSSRAYADSRYRSIRVPREAVPPSVAFFPDEEIVVTPPRLLVIPTHNRPIVNQF